MNTHTNGNSPLGYIFWLNDNDTTVWVARRGTFNCWNIMITTITNMLTSSFPLAQHFETADSAQVSQGICVWIHDVSIIYTQVPSAVSNLKALWLLVGWEWVIVIIMIHGSPRNLDLGFLFFCCTKPAICPY